MENNRHRNNDRAWRRTRPQDVAEIRRALAEASAKLSRLEKDLKEADGAGVLRGARIGALIRTGRGDPTGQAVTSYERIRMESVGEYADRRLTRARKHATALVSALEDGIGAVHEAWLDLDPDLMQDRREKREQAKSYEDAALDAQPA